MKKIVIALFLPLLVTAFFSGCKKESSLTLHISELRSEIYFSEDENIKAAYGFKEEPYVNDGKVGKTVCNLTFYINGKDSDAEDRFVFFTYKGEEYKSAFTLNPVTGTLTAKTEIDNFKEKEFSVLITEGAERKTLHFKSALPNDALSVSDALATIEKSDPDLIQNYRDENGDFRAEIYARIIIKNDEPFWFIGFANGNDRMKALLVNGITGKLLAVREVL